MRFTAVPLLAGLAAAVPLSPYALPVPPKTSGVVARQNGTSPITGSPTDPCNIGFCTLNGGTTGGAAGNTVTVTDVASLKEAAEADEPAVIIVSGALSGSEKIRVASDKTIFGESGSSIEGVGFYINKANNVILRNLKISKVLADNGDAIGIQKAQNVWIDHCDLSSDREHGKDFYDGLLDVTHAADFVTLSNNFIHDHFKASLVGHSDSNGDEDTGHFTITYANNYWKNINSRGPSVRFAKAVHIVNNYEEDIDTGGINARMGAQILLQSSAFKGVEEAVLSKDSDEVGFVTVDDVDLGEGTNTVEAGTLTAADLPYDPIEVLGSRQVPSIIPTTAGATL
ncbi:hypothetical protein DL764_001008 [Monosporascus ibericus]|uniref:pectate lyase n=1 Tax=Monosporascus ibericus TaxID=155417 RepID=A0A4Q4TTP7_9PEZI|nr:hypothetical protein DL764_001008 [Monosporascus ibericus]